jgi:thioredoxin reductase (NADPH)
MKERRFDVIIIGGGPAGLVAGLYSKRAAMETLLVEKGLLGGQIAISKDVENYPGVEGITGFELAEQMVRHARSFGLLIEQREIVEVIPGRGCHVVRTADNDVLRATALILAMGGTARKLGVPGEAEYLGSGVSYCATCDGQFFRERTVVVVGGGDTAVEEAAYLARIANRVFLVHRGDALRASRILQDRVLAESRIEIIGQAFVSEIRGNGEAVQSVVIENIESGDRTILPAEGVFILIGYIPDNRLVPAGVSVDSEGFVVTDEKNASAVPGIFVAGDLRRKYANQIVIAAADGAVAALAASRYVEMQWKRESPGAEGQLCRRTAGEEG